ncbi:hypothetical protein ACQP1W_38840 [Spirillospora sp. CA-255316]
MVRYLDLLAVVLRRKGWRCVELYRRQEFPGTVPLLWVYARGVRDDVGVVVTVYAVPGGRWAYVDAGGGDRRVLVPCGDALAAADHLDRDLKGRLFPGTFAARVAGAEVAR